MADGTSNYMGRKRWAVTGAADDLNIDSDNDTSTTMYFPHPAKLTRFAFLASTSVVSTTAVKVEVYKNTSTLLGTWTMLAANEGLVAGQVSIVDAYVCDADGSVAEDGETRYVGCTEMTMNAGDWLHFKVVEPASASGAGVTFAEFIEQPVHNDITTNVASVGSMA